METIFKKLLQIKNYFRVIRPQYGKTRKLWVNQLVYNCSEQDGSYHVADKKESKSTNVLPPTFRLCVQGMVTPCVTHTVSARIKELS